MKPLVYCLFLFIIISCSSSDSESDTPTPQNNTLASVSVVSISNISENSATSGGNVTNDGGANVTSKGVCWSTSTNPTINDNKTSNGSGIGTYTSELTSLSSNTLYYVRAYATNSEGTAYSSATSFTTEEEPVQCGNVLSTGIELKTQADVEDLGAQGISIINGNLIFNGLDVTNTDPITDLSSLSCLQEIHGSLLFNETSNLVSLSGLENLKYTMGLDIYKTSLESLEPLSNLETIDGIFKLSRNNSLTNLDGLNNVRSVLGVMQISNNDEIIDIEGMESLQSVGENLWLFHNPKLPNLEGLNNLVQIGGQLYVYDCVQLTNIDALSSLEIIGAIKIENNPLIESLSVFSNLTVSSLESLSIMQNDALINLSGLEGITTVTDFLEVDYNDILDDLDELSNLLGIIDRIEIKGNDSLKNINGLINITECQYDVYIDDNPSLESVSGLSALTSVGQIFFRENNLVTNLGFNNLVNVDFDLRIKNNDLLANADGLSNLLSIGGTLEITDNLEFSDLDGLSNLSSIGGDLTIRSLGNLTNVCGLQPLFIANGLAGVYDVSIDDFDVSEQDIIDGNCSQ